MITGMHFPTPMLALRAGVSEQVVRGFAVEQATAATETVEWLRASGLGGSADSRLMAVRVAYTRSTSWRFGLARRGAIVGGAGAADGRDAERFRTPITDRSPNLDRIGEIGRVRDGAAWDERSRTYVGGVDTPASRVAAAYGRAAQARFAVECPTWNELDNPVRLPNGALITGNRLLRWAAARAAGVALAERVADRGLDASRMEIGGDPVYVVTATEADRSRIRQAAFELLAAEEFTEAMWWQAAYLVYQAPTFKKGSDAASRVFLAAMAAWRLGACPVIPQDINLRCMVLGQTAATTLPLILVGVA